MQGIILSKNANLFTVESGGELYKLMPSGKTKDSGLYVGDYVEFGESITKVLPRKNLLVRPPLANLDRLFIVVCPKPKPDFVLVDKILIYCMLKDIEAYIVINKSDIVDEEFLKNITKSYEKTAKILKISAKNGDVKAIEENIKGICALAGQSAVGKSTIINAIYEDEVAEIGHLSKKIERGKQTTRLVTLYKLKEGYLADTAGFSMLDLSIVSDLDYHELSAYYLDFLEGRAECKYRSCLHESVKDCGVCAKVKSGEISSLRYQNYLKILDELKNAKKY